MTTLLVSHLASEGQAAGCQWAQDKCTEKRARCCQAVTHNQHKSMYSQPEGTEILIHCSAFPQTQCLEVCNHCFVLLSLSGSVKKKFPVTRNVTICDSDEVQRRYNPGMQHTDLWLFLPLGSLTSDWRHTPPYAPSSHRIMCPTEFSATLCDHTA